MNFQDITIEKSNDIDDIDFPSPRSPCIQLWQSQQTSVLRVPLNAPLKPARTHYQGRGNYIVRGGGGVSMVTRHCLSRDTPQQQQLRMNDDLLLCHFSFFIQNIHKCVSYGMKYLIFRLSNTCKWKYIVV